MARAAAPKQAPGASSTSSRGGEGAADTQSGVDPQAVFQFAHYAAETGAEAQTLEQHMRALAADARAATRVLLRSGSRAGKRSVMNADWTAQRSGKARQPRGDVLGEQWAMRALRDVVSRPDVGSEERSRLLADVTDAVGGMKSAHRELLDSIGKQRKAVQDAAADDGGSLADAAARAEERSRQIVEYYDDAVTSLHKELLPRVVDAYRRVDGEREESARAAEHLSGGGAP
jgi:hypothetical protein